MVYVFSLPVLCTACTRYPFSISLCCPYDFNSFFKCFFIYLKCKHNPYLTSLVFIKVCKHIKNIFYSPALISTCRKFLCAVCIAVTSCINIITLIQAIIFRYLYHVTVKGRDLPPAHTAFLRVCVHSLLS